MTHRNVIHPLLITPAFLLFLAIASSPASAGTPIDPSTLNPPANPATTVCERVGSNIICDVQFSDPPFAGGTEIICGTGVSAFEPFQFSNRSVRGKRYYDQNGNLLVRHFREVFDLVIHFAQVNYYQIGWKSLN